jgi:hypothetical protein
MLRTDDSAAHASNWKVVLAVDASLGIVISVVGVALCFLYRAAVGLSFIALGSGYTATVGARARRWAQLRRSDPA